METPDLTGANLLLWRDSERDLKIVCRSARTIQSYEEAAQQLARYHDGAGLAEMTTDDVSPVPLPSQGRSLASRS